MTEENIEIEDQPDYIRFSNNLVSITFDKNYSSIQIANDKKNLMIFDKGSFSLVYTRKNQEKRKNKKKILTIADFKYYNHEIKDVTIKETIKTKLLSILLSLSNGEIACKWNFYLPVDKTYILMKVQFTNLTSDNWILHSISPLVTAHDSKWFFDEKFEELKIYYNGYQSWSLSRVFGLNEKMFHSLLSLSQITNHYSRIGAWKWFFRPRGMVRSSGVTVITDPSSKDSITIGFVNFSKFHGFIEVNASKKKKKILGIRAFNPGDDIIIETSDDVESMMLYIQPNNNYPRCLDEYASITAEIMNAIFWSYVPFGYCTWYYYYHKITESDILKDLELSTNNKHNPYFKLDYFQIDDGYQFSQGQCGDWKKTHPQKFPNGFNLLVHEITRRKLMAGLWLAPFNAAISSDLAKNHPGWLIRNNNGKKIKPTFISGKFQHALDITIPEVQEFLKSLFHSLQENQGFSYFKIDFLFSSIVEHARFNNKSLTRIEAFRNMLVMIRESVGDWSFILGCGSPLMESIGLVNGMRISADTAPKWAMLDKFFLKLNIIIPGMKNALLNTITRSWMHKKFWINDPDCVLVRENNSSLTRSEIETELSIIGLSGGQISISESFKDLPVEKYKMISLLQPIYPIPAYSPDMFVREFPKIFMVESSSKSHHPWRVVTLINWKSKPAMLSFNLSELNCQYNKLYHVVDFWENKYVGSCYGNENIVFNNVPPHGCKLIRITEDAKDDKDVLLLGSTLHVLMGALEIKKLSILNDKKKLILEIEKMGINHGSIYVRVPTRIFLDETENKVKNVTDIAENIYKIDVGFKDKLTLSFKIVMV
ncbi:MAG: alpha-galactosidase [Promethearchaeota archaeon]